MTSNKILISGLLFCASAAYADRAPVDHGLFFSGAIQLSSYGEESSGNLSPVALRLSLEKPLTDNLSVRGDYAFGTDSDSREVLSVEARGSFEQAFAGFAKVQTDDLGGFTLYGLIGVTKGEFRRKIDAIGLDETDSESGMSYGVGGSYSLEPGLNVEGEFVSHLDGDEYIYRVLNIGLSKRF
jgi:opacity protein-like surface antigen